MKLSDLELSASDRVKLQEVVVKGSDWRVRHRAPTLLYFDYGVRANDIVMLQDMNIDTVYDRHKSWL